MKQIIEWIKNVDANIQSISNVQYLQGVELFKAHSNNKLIINNLARGAINGSKKRKLYIQLRQVLGRLISINETGAKKITVKKKVQTKAMNALPSHGATLKFLESIGKHFRNLYKKNGLKKGLYTKMLLKYIINLR